MITRFAPSPTGPLHLGHAFSAITAHDMAMAEGGTFLLRIEDIDQTRARPEWEAQIRDDLAWLGLTWQEPVMRQSDRRENYLAALRALYDRDKVYPCTCSRRDILDAASAPQDGAPATGPDGVIYPGTCAPKRHDNHRTPFDPDTAYRLDLAEAFRATGQPRDGDLVLYFDETGTGPDGQTGRMTVSRAAALAGIGDPVLARRGMGTSYHLSVVVDDAAQGVTHVVRGADLFEATHIHVLLQQLLGLPTPVYHHHRLIRDETGKRLAKRDDARAIAAYRAEGATPGDIRRMVGL